MSQLPSSSGERSQDFFGGEWRPPPPSPQIPTQKRRWRRKKKGLYACYVESPSPYHKYRAVLLPPSIRRPSVEIFGWAGKYFFLLLLLPDFQFSVSYYRYVVGSKVSWSIFCIASLLSSNRGGGGGGAIRKRRSETGLNPPSPPSSLLPSGFNAQFGVWARMP